MNAFFELSRENDNRIFCINLSNNFCKPHFHANIEIVEVLGGELEVKINQDERLLSAGAVSVATSYDIHSYYAPEHAECRILIIPPDMAGGVNTILETKILSSSFLPMCERTPDVSYAISKLLEFNGTHDSMIAKGYIYLILGILVEQLGLDDRKEGHSSEQLMRKILIYMEKNYLNNLSVKDLAKEFGYHKDYLSRVINANLGCGFNHYLNVLRARHAAHLIRETNFSLEAISYQSGFGSSQTFNRAFQSFYHVSPHEYKRNKPPRNDADNEVLKDLHNIISL